MDSIFISLGEAENCLTILKSHRATKREKLQKRIRGGLMYEELRFRVCAFRNNPGKRCFRSMLRTLTCYCFGGKVADLLFHPEDNKDETTRMLTRFTLVEIQTLFHWTASQDVDAILKNGLIPGKKLKYVYMTDDPEYIARTTYIYHKVHILQEDTAFVLIKIDARKLACGHQIFWVNALHEFAVDAVPPDCLSLM